MVGMLQLPRDSGGTLEEVVDLDDGSTGYVISYDQTSQQGGMVGMGLPGGGLVLVVGADDFLTREVRVTLEDAADDAPDLVAISYHGYDTPAEIEPPAQYVPIPEGVMEEGSPAEAMVVGLARNADGDVEVTFSGDVHVEGQLELYVIDPSTGGWGLPLLGGERDNRPHLRRRRGGQAVPRPWGKPDWWIRLPHPELGVEGRRG